MASLFRSRLRPAETRSGAPLDLSGLLSMLQFGGHNYALSLNQTLGGTTEEIGGDFAGLVEGAYKRNGIVFACMLTRQLLLSQVRFQFQELRKGRPGDMYGTPALRPLERPSPGQTTDDLLTRMVQDADLAGSWYGVLRKGGRIKRLRPDWVTIIAGSDDDPESDTQIGDIDAEIIGYLYHPGGRGSGRRPEVLLPEYVARFAPVPDPLATFTGMPWLAPVIREVMGDKAMTEHKLKFIEQGATPNVVVSTGIDDIEEFERWTKLFSERSEGIENAYRNLYLSAGASAEVVGADLKSIDFKRVQGAGETRVCAAAGIPPIIVGVSEGLESATYSNYGQARRALADRTLRPTWQKMAGALAPLVEVPSGSRLFYFDRDVPFLQEDVKDMAEIQQVQAQAIRQLIEAGFTADSAVAAVLADDMGKLAHTGLVSVQLQTPGARPEDPPTAGAAAPKPTTPSSGGPGSAKSRPEAKGRERLDLLARLTTSRT